VGKRGRRVAAGQAGPLHRAKLLRHAGDAVIGVVDDHRHEKGLLGGHVVHAVDGEPPLAPEVTLEARLSVGGNDGHEQRAFANLAADLLVPDIPTAQLALVEPDFDAAGSQRLANASGSIRVLRGVAQKDRFRRFGHGRRECRRWLVTDLDVRLPGRGAQWLHRRALYFILFCANE